MAMSQAAITLHPSRHVLQLQRLSVRSGLCPATRLAHGVQLPVLCRKQRCSAAVCLTGFAPKVCLPTLPDPCTLSGGGPDDGATPLSLARTAPETVISMAEAVDGLMARDTMSLSRSYRRGQSICRK